MADNFDDFFDSPRESRIEKKSTIDQECTASENLRCDRDCRKNVGKPPTHPNSRPVSEASKRTSPTVFERTFTDDPQVHSSRRVIEAKVPCDVLNQDNEDGSYSDDSFIEEDDSPSIEARSGRRSPMPRTLNSRQRLESKELSASGYDAGRFVTGSSTQDLSRSFSDDMTDSDDDSEVTDVSPLNTPHSPNIQTTPPCSSSIGRNISKSSNNEPVRLLHGDRDSLDLDLLLQTVLHMEKQGRTKSRQAPTQLAVPCRSSRHNYSFTNEQVEAIDKENRRLMTSIMRNANATKKAKVKVNKLSTSGAGTKRLSSAAVNRAKQQQKIEAENLVNVLLYSGTVGVHNIFERLCYLHLRLDCMLFTHA